MDGAELAIRFSYMPNHLRYCGPDTASNIFLQYLKTKENKKQVREAIAKFEGLYPYLETIAEKTDKDFLDYDVVEAYWIGNDLLKKFDQSDLEKIILKLTKRGLPPSFAQELLKGMPNLPPHHLTHVLYVGVGKTTGTVQTTLDSMNRCRPSWARVADIKNQTLTVATHSLIKEDEKYVLAEDTMTAMYLPEMFPQGLAVGSDIAIHWGLATMTLSNQQAQNLKEYTEKILKALNV